MRFPIGFTTDTAGRAPGPASRPPAPEAPRPSVVQVHFPIRGMTLAYYNDRFDLRPGDLVYVDGKLAGQRGRVTEVNYNFRIRLADYKRVIARVDTDIRGQFFLAGSHLVTFDREVLPVEKVRFWFQAPEEDGEDGYRSGSDESAFPLEDPRGMGASPAAAERGHGYYVENRVRYLSLDAGEGYAIVEGSKPYELRFSCQDGLIRHLTCSCYCGIGCKHAFAAMLQLRETLEKIQADYAPQYGGYFAAVHKGTLLSLALDGRETGSLTLG